MKQVLKYDIHYILHSGQSYHETKSSVLNGMLLRY